MSSVTETELGLEELEIEAELEELLAQELREAEKEGKATGPKPRKRRALYQAYQWRMELMRIETAHRLRLKAIERGASNMDAQQERDYIAWTHKLLLSATRAMKAMGLEYGGDTWRWLTSIRGLAEGGLAAQVMAQIDDIALFDTVSKLWRFAGWAVIEGEIERNHVGEESHFNRKLKTVSYQIAVSFMNARTPLYRDLYDEEREYQRRMHPVTMCLDEGIPWKRGCKAKKHKMAFNDGHLHNRALRKVAKIFLSHLWVVWRLNEGLPVTKPYAEAILGHENIIDPPILVELPKISEHFVG